MSLPGQTQSCSRISLPYHLSLWLLQSSRDYETASNTLSSQTTLMHSWLLLTTLLPCPGKHTNTPSFTHSEQLCFGLGTMHAAALCHSFMSCGQSDRCRHESYSSLMPFHVLRHSRTWPKALRSMAPLKRTRRYREHSELGATGHTANSSALEAETGGSKLSRPF